jgi:hypothetical protein
VHWPERCDIVKTAGLNRYEGGQRCGDYHRAMPREVADDAASSASCLVKNKDLAVERRVWKRVALIVSV